MVKVRKSLTFIVGNVEAYVSITAQATLIVPPWYIRALKAAELDLCVLGAPSGEEPGKHLTYRWEPDGNLFKLEIDLHLPFEEDDPRLDPLRIRLDMVIDGELVLAGESCVEEISSTLARAQFYVCQCGVFRISPV
jgi:hypothetical protein